MSYSKKRIKKCPKCNNKLWEWIDEDTVKILGTAGQDYKIGFNYIDLVCKKCGQRVCEQSEVAEYIKELFERTSKTVKSLRVSSIEERPFTAISNFDIKKIKKSLSQKQKEVLRVLTNGDWSLTDKEISKKVGLPEKIVHKHVREITEKIKEIDPYFGRRNLDIKSR
jgi:DNA-binding NarL/FixJ family response regulator